MTVSLLSTAVTTLFVWRRHNMKYNTSIFKESEGDPNKIPGALWKTFHNFGELGEYRILAQTEECVVIRLENETGEGDMVLYQVFDGIFLMYNDFHMSQYHSMYQAVDTMLAVDYCREGNITMELDNGRCCMKKREISALIRVSTIKACPTFRRTITTASQ